MQDAGAKAAHADRVNANVEKAEAMGRWPANLCHDGSTEVVAPFPVTGASKAGGTSRNTAFGRMNDDGWVPKDTPRGGFDDAGGSAARYFYCAKASKRDRGDGNTHCTVKPTALMQYLCRLVMPPGGVVLDPFMGSGSTGKAAAREGFRFIGIEREAEYVAIAEARIKAALASTPAAPAAPETMPLFDQSPEGATA
jgi:site-specific DNA-methyltransferase (adenine-specific)